MRTSLRRPGLLSLPPVLLLTLFAGLAVASVRGSSVTGDEVAHLPAGYTYVRTGDFRLNPQHPPLMKALAGLPLLALDLEPVDRIEGWREAEEWGFGRAFLTSNRAPLEQIVLLARLPMVAIGVVLGAALFGWARDLWGYGPALFVLALYALSPNLLAHTGLVTTDVGVSCFTVLTLWALWRFQRGGGRLAVLAGGLALGCALLAKYTGVVTAGLVALLLAGAWVLRRSAGGQGAVAAGGAPGGDADAVAAELLPRSRRLTLARALAALVVIACLALLVVAVGFGAPHGLAHYRDGFGRIYADANPRWQGFLWGEFSPTGFRYYYLLATLWKTPLPTLIAFLIALLSLSAPTVDRRIDWLFVLLPFAAFQAAGVFNQANIGIRHVLPSYPFLFLACGAAAARLGRAGLAGRATLVGLGLWLAAGTITAHPNYLSYFNELAGGSANGIRYLDDSNVEWGQDYLRLARWVERRRPAELALLAFEPLPPATYGLRYRTIRLADVTRPRTGVTYVGGAHYLQRNSLYDDYPGVRFEWLERYRPVEIVGGSLYVYRFSVDPADQGSPDVIYVPRERWYRQSIEQLVEILERSPRFGLARSLLTIDYLDRARWREQDEDPEEALYDYVRAVEVSGRAPEPARELEAALSRLRPALQAGAMVAPGPWCLEGTYDRAGAALGPALVALVRCLAVRPEELAARANLGWTLIDLGLLGPARAELLRCVELDPAFGPALAGLRALGLRATPDSASAEERSAAGPSATGEPEHR